MRGRRLVVLLVLPVLLVAGCGVSAENEPRPVNPPRSPFGSRESVTVEPEDSGTTEERLCFVRDDKLVVVVRRPSSYPTVNLQLRHLIAGPTPTERNNRLSNPLSDGNIAANVRLVGTEAIVEFRAEVDTSGRNDESLMYGQIVCTLTSRSDVSGVSFSQGGERLGIPRADGSLSSGPLTAADYADLILSG
jgi:spore germination protein GerM